MSNFIRKVSLNIKHKDSGSPERSPSTSNGAKRQSTFASTDEHINGLVNRHSSTSKGSSGEEKDKTHHNRLASVGSDLINKLHHREHSPGSRHGSASPTPGPDGGLSKNQLKKQEKLLEEQQRKERQHRESLEVVRKRQEADEKAKQEDSAEMLARYGRLPVNNYAGEWTHKEFAKFVNLKKEDIGKTIFFRARLHNMRKMSAKLVFFILRQQTVTIQGLVAEGASISSHMVHWAEHIPVETVLDIVGTIQEPKAKEGEVVGTVIHNMEILINEMHIVSKLTEHLPFTVHEAEVTEIEANAPDSTRHFVGDRTRLQSRILDLRTTTSQAIFRVQAGVCRYFRNFLDDHGFMEIHTPKLQGGATESGASVFKVDYFGRLAFLAQSPQLAKQGSICADFGRVYEIGAVFRAENSNTHRHLTEYTGLDIEMALEEHYWEIRTMVDGVIKAIFEGVYKHHKHEIETIKRQYPHEDLVWLDETPIIPFKEAVRMLTESGYRDEKGNEIPNDEDFGTRDEIAFGRLMKEKYKTDYYIVDKFPTSARPFYTMRDPVDPTYTNSFDIFVRGQEITTGGQRVHDAEMLVAQMEKAKVDPKTMEEYMQGFYWGAPPHAGAGIGLERILMLMLQLNDIRHASLYPRDPKSLPAKAVVKQLRHPEASTLHPPWEGKGHADPETDLQPLEKLIANYGDASNTSWLEPRMVIWRDVDTGAAVAYVPHQGFAVTVADPLCDSSQYVRVMATYLDFIKRDTELKPLWLLCGADVEDTLAAQFNWRTFSVAAEQRLDLTMPLKALADRDVLRKIRHSEKEGVKIHDIPLDTRVPAEVVQKCDARIKDWLGARKNHQHVHLTDVHPWQDMDHRAYHYATDKAGTIVALVVMALLSPEHGWQVKYALDFPNAPSGAIENVVTHALAVAKSGGARSVTFGAGASASFTAGHNLKGTKVKMLSKAYHTISTELKLTQKSEFREKLGAEDDPIYVCYPPKGLGPKGVHAILSFFED